MTDSCEGITIEKIEELINKQKKLINGHIDSITTFLSKDDLKRICKDYREHKNKFEEEEKELNIFRVISDLYYRENLHSDIIKFFLDPTETHKEGYKYLNLFIDLLNSLSIAKKLNIKIDKENYIKCEVTREENHIDILILSKESKKAIIIENKINNAVDMTKQLPRYSEYLKTKRFETDAIVYLPLDRNKQPDEHDWSDEEIKKINEKLILLFPYNEKENDLYNGWLKPCEEISNNIDSFYFLRQYKKLIKHLGGYIMDIKMMGEFYNKLIKADNYQTAKSIKDMLDELPQYLAIRLRDYFDEGKKKEPFERIEAPYHDSGVIFWTFKFKKSDFTIEMYCEFNWYEIAFWDREDDLDKNETKEINSSSKILIKQIGLDNEFDINQSRSRTIFYKTEEEIKKFLDGFLEKLNNYIKEN